MHEKSLRSRSYWTRIANREHGHAIGLPGELEKGWGNGFNLLTGYYGSMNENAAVAQRDTIELCQKILRISTGIILAAFALIIVVTTISTQEWVLLVGKALYYIIVLDAFVSLGVWYYRTRLEKSMVEEGAG